MKIGIPSLGENIRFQFAPNFGRCPYFVIYDTTKEEVLNIYMNKAQNASGGAGIQAAQSMIDNQVESVIAPQMGPNAWNVLQNAGIKIYRGIPGTVQRCRGTVDGATG